VKPEDALRIVAEQDGYALALPRKSEPDAGRLHRDATGEAIPPRRYGECASPLLDEGVQGGLEGGSVVGLAVAHRAEIADGEAVPLGGRCSF
jgi:hypothetical protein